MLQNVVCQNGTLAHGCLSGWAKKLSANMRVKKKFVWSVPAYPPSPPHPAPPRMSWSEVGKGEHQNSIDRCELHEQSAECCRCVAPVFYCPARLYLPVFQFFMMRAVSLGEEERVAQSQAKRQRFIFRVRQKFPLPDYMERLISVPQPDPLDSSISKRHWEILSKQWVSARRAVCEVHMAWEWVS